MIASQSDTVCFDADVYPWGAEQQVNTNTCPAQNYLFSGNERDPDMGSDYFGARFYKGDMSRSSLRTGRQRPIRCLMPSSTILRP